MAAGLVTEGIWCGDCEKLLKQVPDDSVDLCFTSPPYVDLGKLGPREVRIPADGYVEWFLPKAAEVHRILRSHGSFIVNIKDRVVQGERHLYVLDMVAALKRKLGYRLYEILIWDKVTTLPQPKRFRDVFEYVFWFTKTADLRLNLAAVRQPYAASTLKGTHRIARRWYPHAPLDPSQRRIWRPHPDGALPSNLIRMVKTTVRTGHTAMFPEALARFFIMAGSNPGDLVLDPFMGSGTTAVAAVKLGRRYLGMDLLPEYCRTARKRIEAVKRGLAGGRDSP